MCAYLRAAGCAGWGAVGWSCTEIGGVEFGVDLEGWGSETLSLATCAQKTVGTLGTA